MAERFELKKSKDGQFMFNLIAPDGEVILTSERYKAKGGAKNGISSVKTNAPLDDRYDRLTSAKNEPYFTLKAANGEVIGRSEMYSSTGAMENGIASVQKNAPAAPTDDVT